ncbi:serine/threonine-protein kinase [Nonomuraea rubra]|uniref:Serine/threonine protein kinase n=1 Tax=Nonomuraea rubra TaxID=46180 RepID=A0A7X0TZE8_9ACTN|nr:serine/threonine-protein kinase [Nonomuraea rubra]MBB6549602.1 serine/threonine protein kinase [Nonomuraea rubra]
MTGWAPGSVVAGDFVVERELGRGGYGRVVLAQSRRSGTRYAIKRLVRAEPAEQGRLLAEAQRWVALPPHPHITACHFVRTVGEEVAVFSEYAPGGSLADRIGRRDLTGPEIQAIALQTAWGLDAVHAMGLLHLDMKPANVLFGADGLAKIADFGLAAGDSTTPAEHAQLEAVIDYVAGDLGETVKHLLWTQFGGGDATLAAVPSDATSAYASPEQAERRAAGPGADLWSWAVTVLEMYAGERTWPSGTVAPFVLDAIVRGRRQCRVPLPPAVTELLQACFALDPDDRPRSAGEAAAALHVPGLTPPERPSVLAVPRSRALGESGGWDDPRRYLHFAYEAAGRDPGEALAHWPRRGGGFSAQVLADLRAFQEASAVLRDAPATAQNVEVLARIEVHESRIRQALGDADGAIAHLESAAGLLDTGSAGHRTLRPWTLHWLAIALRRGNRLPEAISASDAAIAGADDLPDADEAARLRGSALLSKANTMNSAGAAAAETAVPLRAALTELRSSGDRRGQARVLAAMAAQREQEGDEAGATALWDEADALLAGPGAAGEEEPGDQGVQVVRALMAMNRAALATRMEAQLLHAERAVELLAPLVERHGRYDLSTELASACMKAGYAHEHLGRPQEALSAYRRGRKLYERVVLRDGRTDLADELSECLEFESTLTFELHGAEQALEPVGVAVDRWRRLVDLEGMEQWGRQLIRARVRLAVTLEDAGRPGALDVLDEAARDVAALGEDRTPQLIRQDAMIHRERGVVHRRAGDLQAAYDECREALLLADGAGPEPAVERVLILETLSAILSEAGHADEALHALATATGESERLASAGERDPAWLAASHRRLASLLLETGRLEESAEEAGTASALYAEVIAGRPDLRFDALRCAYLAGAALHMLGRVEQAADAYRQARGFGGDLRDDDLAMRRLTSNPAAARRYRERTAGLEVGEPDAAMLLRVLEGQIGDLDALLALRPDELDGRLAEIGTSMRNAGELGRGGLTQEASRLLEPLLGTTLWLSRTFRRDDVAVLAGELGLRLGVTSLHAQRDAPALRGFRSAVRSLGELADRPGGDAYRERWFDAHLGLATCLTVLGDHEGADEVGRTLDRQVRRWAPESVQYWRQRLSKTLEGLRG